MRKIAPLLFLLMISSFTTNAQVGMYVNVFGSYVPFQQDYPSIQGFSPTADGGFITSGLPGSNFPYCALAKMDSSLNRQWARYYNAPSSGIITTPVELRDGGFLSLYDQSPYKYFKTDSVGNIAFLKQYLLAPNNDDLASNRYLASCGTDSGFVTMFAECALHYSLAKFDKDGNNIWTYEYISNSLLGGTIYQLDYALGNSGYLTSGQRVHPNGIKYDGLIMHIDDAGNMVNNVVIEYDSVFDRSYAFPFRSESDNKYYAVGYNSATPAPPYFFITQFDSNLVPAASWRFDPPTAGGELSNVTAVAGSDQKIVLIGTMRNPSTGYHKFFILKFDPATGTIVWCKTVVSLSFPVPYSFGTSLSHLYVNNNADKIVFALVSGNDGFSIAGIRGDGTGSCIAVDTTILVSPFTNYTYYQIPVARLAQTIVSVNHPITLAEQSTTDKVWCNTPVGVDEQNNLEALPELISYTISNGQLEITSQSDDQLSIRVYNAEGKLLATEKLSKQERFKLPVLTAGIYFVQAIANQNVQTKKILATD
jgi:Secretion system C-terminal sorting domain